MSAAANPYRAPEAQMGGGLPDVGEDAVAIRNEYLSHEAAVKSIGSLYYLSAFFFAVATIAFLTVMDGEGAHLPRWFSLMFLGFGMAFAWMGRAMRRLDATARIPVAIVAGLGLFNPPVGTLINGYILYLVFGRKGRMVFSEEYAAVREATPEIVYRTSTGMKVALLLLLACFVAGAIAISMSG